MLWRKYFLIGKTKIDKTVCRHNVGVICMSEIQCLSSQTGIAKNVVAIVSWCFEFLFDLWFIYITSRVKTLATCTTCF